MVGLGRKLSQIRHSITKHLVMRSSEPYEQILKYAVACRDIWIAAQGEYILWWQRRENAALRVIVADGVCQVRTSLENGVVEKYPGEFLDIPVVPWPETEFSGEVWITVDSALGKKDLLVEILRREGILNFRVAAEGEFMLPRQEMAPLLEEIDAKWQEWGGRLFGPDVYAVRQMVVDKLAAHHLPLFRIWYHPRVNGIVPRAVLSPRWDVDRAITNLAHIRALEEEYGVSSTVYVRAFGPFYGDREIMELASSPLCPEIALHGEFTTNARRYGDEFKAAVAERAHLERLIGRPVRGVSMHGGELTDNKTENTAEVVQETGFLYDTTPAFPDYFPFREVVRGRSSRSYGLAHTLGDIDIPPDGDYARAFYRRTIAKMDEICEQNGVFVLLLHPVYFGFFEYLSRPRNWVASAKFFLRYFGQPRG